VNFTNTGHRRRRGARRRPIPSWGGRGGKSGPQTILHPAPAFSIELPYSVINSDAHSNSPLPWYPFPRYPSVYLQHRIPHQHARRISCLGLRIPFATLNPAIDSPSPRSHHQLAFSCGNYVQYGYVLNGGCPDRQDNMTQAGYATLLRSTNHQAATLQPALSASLAFSSESTPLNSFPKSPKPSPACRANIPIMWGILRTLRLLPLPQTTNSPQPDTSPSTSLNGE
jgi:hypothetical protein